MEPRLIRFDETNRYEIAVDCDPFTIGRDVANALRIDDPMVSQHHCQIESRGDRFVLADRKSTNGTYVNGRRIQQKDLEHGDEIRIGYTILVFTRDVWNLPAVSQVEDDGEPLETRALNPADSAYFKPTLPADLSSFQRITHDLTVILKLSVEFNQIEDAERMQAVLLERLFDIVPAENGAVLLCSERGEFSPNPVHRQRTPDQQFRISRTITRQVLESGKALLRNDLLDDVSTSESIRFSGIRSVVCVPLTTGATRIGVVYLDTRNPQMRFDERHLEIVSAISAVGALALEHARYVDWLEKENRQLIHNANLQHDMVGDSPKMQKVFEALSRIAPVDTPVLLLGESGTGKELAARAIHKNSSRRNGPFVAVNCGAVNAELFASELFGHVRGGFTGADRDRKGFIEEADGGTLFLDELGELPLHCQAALLRVLEDGQVIRVGSTRPISVNIRIISATNRPLPREIDEGGFRADLYYRMGLSLELPPLRERLEDIPLLVRFFLQIHKSKTQRELGPTPPDTIRALQEYHWPGNVRELSRAIEWAVVFGKSDRIRCDDLPPHVIGKPSRSQALGFGTLDEAMESFERQFILRALEEARGNVVEASSLIGRAPNYLQRRISALNLRSELDVIRKRR
jgi:transcriptional regulator with GAF, ATPase, and Fis domain